MINLWKKKTTKYSKHAITQVCVFDKLLKKSCLLGIISPIVIDNRVLHNKFRRSLEMLRHYYIQNEDRSPLQKCTEIYDIITFIFICTIIVDVDRIRQIGAFFELFEKICTTNLNKLRLRQIMGSRHKSNAPNQGLLRAFRHKFMDTNSLI